MKNIVAIIVLFALASISCSIRQPAQKPAEEESRPGEPLFDPLATAADREIVPEVYPVSVAMAADAGDSLIQPRESDFDAFDSSSSEINPREVYRIQIFTSRLYNEANQELALAEEIFNLPVHLDYEVPYYKLRVGDFTERNEAEDMLPEIRAIGYRDAWVARVIKKIREVPLYEMLDEPILPFDSVEFSPVVPDSMEIEKEGDDL